MRSARARSSCATRLLDALGEDEKLLLDAWELVPEGIIAFARAWPEAETLAAAERDLDRRIRSRRSSGLLAFYAGRFQDAEQSLRTVADDAVAAHWLGCALERLGRDAEADRELARAAKLDSERFVNPFRCMAEKEFRACVEAAFAELPYEIRSAIEERCALVVEDWPSASAVANGLDPLNLGEFRGDDLGEVERSTSEVVLYKRNLEKISASKDDLIEEARVTPSTKSAMGAAGSKKTASTTSG